MQSGVSEVPGVLSLTTDDKLNRENKFTITKQKKSHRACFSGQKKSHQGFKIFQLRNS